jgi:rhamnosyl/mannosyltransferase
LKILHVYRTYFPDTQGGGQEAIRQIVWATRSLGIESRIFSLSTSPHPRTVDRPEGLVVRSRSWIAPASCDIGGPDAFRVFLEQSDWADVVQYHFPWPFADMLNLAASHRKPRLLTYHSDIVRQQSLGALYRPLMKHTLATMNAVVATSQAYLDSSEVLASCVDVSRRHVVPLGIVEASYSQAISDGESVDVEDRFGVAPGDYFLAIGVLRYYKGLHTLVDAARLSGQAVIIAGSGPEHDRLARQIADTGAPVKLVGQVTEAEKCALIRQSIAVVLPSHLRSEAFGMVLVEAAMLGRPMISCSISTGTTFVNADGETGLVVPPESSEALGAAMTTLAKDSLLAARMGVESRARYERLFSGPALGRGYGDIYARLVEAKR